MSRRGGAELDRLPGRYKRLGYFWAYFQRRRHYLVIAVILATLAAGLVWYASGVPDSFENLALNLGADLIGTIFLVFLIGPMIERGELRRDSVLERFNHPSFIRRVADARHRILILELWTDLLQGDYKRPFLTAIDEALRQHAEVRILLLDPDARAAEQRADDLLRQTNVVENIMGNLRTLYEYQRDLPEHLRGSVEVRIYSALPPVQMYRVDDRVIVSFYPVNVTSWNAAQYQTSPDAQLGTFVGTKFDELWEAANTRTLDQFRNLEVDTGPQRDPYQVRFVHDDEATYVSGRTIVDDHLERGIRELQVRVVNANARGEREASEVFELLHLEAESAEHTTARQLFRLKYGRHQDDVILKLVQAQE